MEKLVLVDGHSIINRAFYGVPELTNSAGLHTNAVYGFLNILFKILDEEQADYLAVAFDLPAPTFRHEKFPEYKGCLLYTSQRKSFAAAEYSVAAKDFSVPGGSNSEGTAI